GRGFESHHPLQFEKAALGRLFSFLAYSKVWMRRSVTIKNRMVAGNAAIIGAFFGSEQASHLCEKF
ncbi:hypothetical protein, partial [Gluconobacter thailandicus]|uniref:hypothetical protein n=1 Tax=Gluconobacter thailandicus TaxID=257438 RepID=UPI000A77BEB6